MIKGGINIFIWIGLVLLGLSACSDDKEDDNNDINFDQKVLLENLSDNLIIPNYLELEKDVNHLKIAVDSFNQNPSNNTLSFLKDAFEESYVQWQTVSFLEFGPANNVGLRTALNAYPTDIGLIEQNILSNNYNLDAFTNLAARGFPAIDYLLYNNNDSTIIANFSDSNRKDYLENVTEKMYSQISVVVSDWTSSYSNTFKNQLGTDIGSSLGLLINTLNQHYERNFRDGKIGIPLGIRSSGVKRLSDEEARFSAISFDLVRQNMEAMKEIYKGENGVGLDDYLLSADASEVDRAINAQIIKIESELNKYPSSVKNAIEDQNQELLNTYQEIQKLIVYWKVDMPSRLGVLITYQDNDGD